MKKRGKPYDCHCWVPYPNEHFKRKCKWKCVDEYECVRDLVQPLTNCYDQATHCKRKERIKMNDLRETVELMESADYKDRFKAEYYQTKIRYDKLHIMIVKYDAGVLDFEPTCPISVLKEQAKYMGMYLYQLEVRAQMEGIEL